VFFVDQPYLHYTTPRWQMAMILQKGINCNIVTSIYANADGLRDAASRKIDHIARPTKHNYQTTSVGW